MSKLSPKPKALNWRALLGSGLGLVLLALSAVTFLRPRPVAEEDVRTLCEREVRRQTVSLGTRVVNDFRQRGLTATFTLVPLVPGSEPRTAVTCTVSGNARKPDVMIQMQE